MSEILDTHTSFRNPSPSPSLSLCVNQRLAAILCTGGPDVIRAEAWSLYRTISGVRLCWELEEPKGPTRLSPVHEGMYRGASLIRNPHPPLGSTLVPRHRATVGSYGGAVSYERGTPVRTRTAPSVAVCSQDYCPTVHVGPYGAACPEIRVSHVHV